MADDAWANSRTLARPRISWRFRMVAGDSLAFVARHFEFVPAARARELVGQVLEPLVSDMHKVRNGEWARLISDEIRAVVRLSPLKGAQYDIVYGVCCTWVPLSAGRSAGYAWPRTMRQTRPHLWVDHFVRDAEPRQWICTSEGEWVLRRQAQLACSRCSHARRTGGRASPVLRGSWPRRSARPKTFLTSILRTARCRVHAGTFG